MRKSDINLFLFALQVEVMNERPSNVAFRNALSGSLKIPGVSPEELQGSAAPVWWDKEADKEKSSNWRK